MATSGRNFKASEENRTYEQHYCGQSTARHRTIAIKMAMKAAGRLYQWCGHQVIFIPAMTRAAKKVRIGTRHNPRPSYKFPDARRTCMDAVRLSIRIARQIEIAISAHSTFPRVVPITNAQAITRVIGAGFFHKNVARRSPAGSRRDLNVHLTSAFNVTPCASLAAYALEAARVFNAAAEFDHISYGQNGQKGQFGQANYSARQGPA